MLWQNNKKSIYIAFGIALFLLLDYFYASFRFKEWFPSSIVFYYLGVSSLIIFYLPLSIITLIYGYENPNISYFMQYLLSPFVFYGIFCFFLDRFVVSKFINKIIYRVLLVLLICALTSIPMFFFVPLFNE